MTFASLAGRANSELLIGDDRKLEFIENMTNYAISGMTKSGMPIHKGGAFAGENTGWCSWRGGPMVEAMFTRAAVEDVPGHAILNKKTRGVKFHINIIIISKFLNGK